MSGQPAKPGTPVVGFNHNLNHKGRVFHVQTEDSGPQHGHILTHIFMGGNILASTKGTYAELLSRLGPGEVASTVRKMMEDQHKGMVKSLMGGVYDADIARRTGSDTFYEPGVLANGERAPGLLVGGEKTAPKSADGPASLPPAAARSPAANTIPPPAMKAAPGPGSRPPLVPEVTIPPSALRPAAGVPVPRMAVPIALASSVPRSTRPASGPTTEPGMVPAPAGWPVPPQSARAQTPAPRRNQSSMPTPTPIRAGMSAPVPIAARPLDEIVFNYLIADLENQHR